MMGPVSLRRSAVGPLSGRVLLLHGMGLSSAMWDGFAEHAPAGLELWTADLPWTRNGTGDWTRDQDVARWAARALRPECVPAGTQFFDAVVAHSYSATAFLGVLAGQHDVPVPRAAVLVAPFYRAHERDFDLSSLAYSLRNFPRLFEQGIRVSARRPIDPDVLASMAQRLCDGLGPRVWLRFSDTYLATPDLPVSRITVPALVLAGGSDTAAVPSDAAALADALPSSCLEVMAGCGHFPMVEDPFQFTELVGGFLARQLMEEPAAGHHSGWELVRPTEKPYG